MTSNEFDLIVSKLNATYTTGGDWMAPCPCHQDDSPSLSLKFIDSKLLVHCFAGCDRDEVFRTVAGLIPRVKPATEKVLEKNRIEHTYYNEDGSIHGKVTRNYYSENGEIKKKMYSQAYDNKANNWAVRENGRLVGLSYKTCPLYNLQGLLAAPPEKSIFIVEGEKKVDILVSHGLIAVCNQGGAGKWRADNNKYLLGRVIILCPDIDDAGYSHVSLVAHMLRASGINQLKLLDLGDKLEKGEDVYDFVHRFGITELRERCKRLPNFPEIKGDSESLRELEKEAKEATKLEPAMKGKKATTADYQDFFRTVIPIRRDMFSGEGMYYDGVNGVWDNVVNRVATYRCELENLLASGCPIKFNVTRVLDHLDHYVNTLPAEFLIDVEKWDGVDRMKELANRLTFANHTQMTPEYFEYFLKDWWQKTIGRAFNPEIQNRIIVLQGSQGKGKDYFVDRMTHALGQFAVPFQVTGDGNKDMYLQLSQAMVLKIGEFDKTGRMHVSILKDIITSINTQIRSAYDRKAKIRPSRASFISTANVEDLLRDHTGNRRYLVFMLKDINKEKPITDRDSVQILAQAWHYYEQKTVWDKDLVEKAEACMFKLIERMTPENPEDIVIEVYNQEIESLMMDREIEHQLLIEKNGYLTQDQAQIALEAVSKRVEYPVKIIRTILKRLGYQKVITVKDTNGVYKSQRVWLMSPSEDLVMNVIDARPQDEAKMLQSLEKIKDDWM